MDISSFKWLNESKMTTGGDTVTIFAPPGSDYFNDPVPQNGALSKPQGNAPFFYTDVTGDFVIRVKVRPNFKSTYDAACIMVMRDGNTWLKAAFEQSDFGTKAVVSVVTNRVSDDANGCNIDADEVWLQVARVGNNFAVHYSIDGVRYDMVRLCTLPADGAVKVGIQAQCPMGQGGDRVFSGLCVEQRTVDDLRKGR